MNPINRYRPHVFPSYRNPLEPMNSQMGNMALKQTGFMDLFVAHGMRLRTSIILTVKGFAPNVIETALAHIDTKEVPRASKHSI